MSSTDHYARLHGDFAWAVPEKFNIAEMCLHRWARDTPDAVAILQDAGDGGPVPFTYAALQRDARRLSNALGSLGVTRGDRVAVIMPQRPQTAVALMAVFQMGAHRGAAVDAVRRRGAAVAAQRQRREGGHRRRGRGRRHRRRCARPARRCSR